VGDFIPRPGFLYLFRARNTFSNWKKKKSRMGNVQNFPLTTMGVFPDQEGKIPRKSWNSISIFYSAPLLPTFSSHPTNCRWLWKRTNICLTTCLPHHLPTISRQHHINRCSKYPKDDRKKKKAYASWFIYVI
jgi:hypothetical protein